ncbi:PHD-finger motif containing protein [Ascosphaera apis ARSEF 7405]|uniref:PHD-finger motif containing protein n=1 Tax=Ascosphaera apis ARSEF 7405 TaxID=392613 RepID=A0A167XFP8_9EURO|nr:PHD-finger motif containing protein [Ascosphaera apis ARSEF 7405]
MEGEEISVDVNGSVPPEDVPTSQTTRSSTVKEEPASELNIVDVPRKISDLRDDSMSRASSLDRFSPVAFSSRQQSVVSVAPQIPSSAPPKKRSTTGPPKGIAIRKPANKRRKLDSNGKEIPPEPKKPRKKPAAKSRPVERNGPDLFCICRTADDHTWMIACDGGCDDWFHGKCVNIDEGDSELIDKYICPSCQERDGKHTTFKPMCRYPSCRKPARATDARPSKYCSDEHGEILILNEEGVDRSEPPNYSDGDEDTEDEPTLQPDAASRGGILSAPELKALIEIVKSAVEFRNLGNEKDDNAFINMEIDKSRLTSKEEEHILRLRDKLYNLKKDADRLRDRERLFLASRHHGKTVVNYLKANELPKMTKSICLFDFRLCWSDVEFDNWRSSETGRAALDACELPETSKILQNQIEKGGKDSNTKEPLDDLVNAAVVEGLCLKRKKCQKHTLWPSIQEEDILHEIRFTNEAIKKTENELIDVMRSVYFRITGEPNPLGIK